MKCSDSRITTSIIVAVISALVVGCDPRIVAPPPTDGFLFSSPRTIRIQAAPGQTVVDQESGAEFMFPNGGAVDMTVESILQAPPRSLPGGSGIRLKINSPVAIEYKTGIPDSGERLVYAWLPASGAYTGERPENDWYAIPGRASNGSQYYPLNISIPEKSGGRSAGNNYLGYLWTQTVDPPPNAEMIKRSAEDILEDMIFELDPSLQESVANKRAKYPYTIYFRDPSLDSFYTRGTIYGACVYLRTDSEPGIIAHEMAHYLNDLMVSDAYWDYLKENSPKEHSIGCLLSRQSVLIEDFAFLLAGLVDLELIQIAPSSLRFLYDNVANTDQVDRPSLEGFLAILATWLTESAVSPMDKGDFKAEKSTIPMSFLSLGEIASLISKEDKTIDEFVESIIEKASSIEDEAWKENFAGAVAERMGWSYPVKGRVSLDGAYVSGVNVECLTKAESYMFGVEEFYAPSVKTSADGRFTLPRAFPGKQILRFSYENGETEYSGSVELVIPWGNPTNEEVVLQDIVLEGNSKANRYPIGWVTSTNGEYIVYYQSTEGTAQFPATQGIYKIRPDGTGKARIPIPTPIIGGADVSYDGKIITRTSEQDHSGSLKQTNDFAMYDLDGVELDRFEIFDDDSLDDSGNRIGIELHEWNFSGDGSGLVATGNKIVGGWMNPTTRARLPLRRDLHLLSSPGAAPVRLTFYYDYSADWYAKLISYNEALMPIWCQNAGLLAWSRPTVSESGPNSVDLVLTDESGGNMRTLLSSNSIAYSPVRFSSDFTSLLVASTVFDGVTWNLAWVNILPSGDRTLRWVTQESEAGRHVSGVRLSPDGNRLVVGMVHEDGRYHLKLMDSDGTDAAWFL